MDFVWLGSQAFSDASAFNANIGAWNTARITTLESVCTAFGGAPPRRTRSAGLRCGAAVVRGGTADARAHTRIGTRLGGCPCVYVWLRVGEDGIYVYEYIYI